MAHLPTAQFERMVSLIKAFMKAVDANDLSAYVPIDEPQWGGCPRYNVNVTAKSDAGNQCCIDLDGRGFVFSYNGRCYA